jgi:coenzyme F420 biosynthesis associated uncharacterized protein
VIDWNLAGQVARGLAGLQPAGDPRPFEKLSAPAAESERLVSAYTGLLPQQPLPVAEAVDRGGWIDANLRSLGGVLDPVSERLASRLGPLGGAVGALLALEAGAVSGFLGGRVLGQYEFPPLDPSAPPRLLFVAPNLGHAATTLDAEPDQLLRWVALHETTHAIQFSQAPWLREHIGGLIRQLLSSAAGGLGLPDLLRRLASRPRDTLSTLLRGDIARAIAGPEQAPTLDRIQAVMTVIEGHAEHVMDAAASDFVEDVGALRDRLDQRRSQRGPLEMIAGRLLGMDLKLRQYELGKAFCDEVARTGGLEALNRVWEGPDALPAPDELDRPTAWLERIATSTARPPVTRS